MSACPTGQCELGPSFCPPCQDPFNPNCPPPGWPEPFAPWAQRGSIPAATRCNLTPPLINISARKAFCAYQKQSIDGGKGVVIFDVRDPNEQYWIGVPAQVNSMITTRGRKIIPDYYYAVLKTSDGECRQQYWEYRVKGKKRVKFVECIKSADLTGMVYNIPVELINGSTGKKTLNPLFGKQIDALISALKPTRVIFFCRSGQRSSIGCYYQYCPFGLFPQIIGKQIIAYEVEAKINGNGGFEGSDYSRRYLGYRGFPGRVTKCITETASVSFKDMNLPVITTHVAKNVIVNPDTGELISFDQLDAAPWCKLY